MDNHTINYIKRTLFCFDRAYTTDIDIAYFTRTLAGSNIHTGSFSLHTFEGIFDRHGFQFFFTHTCHSTSHITFFLNTITNHYHFIQCFGILLQDYFNGRLSFHLDIYGLVPHKTYLDRSIIRNILKCELTIKVGNCTIGSTFHHHTGTDYRLTCFVKDSTQNGFALCKGPYSQYG